MAVVLIGFSRRAWLVFFGFVVCETMSWRKSFEDTSSDARARCESYDVHVRLSTDNAIAHEAAPISHRPTISFDVSACPKCPLDAGVRASGR